MDWDTMLPKLSRRWQGSSIRIKGHGLDARSGSVLDLSVVVIHMTTGMSAGDAGPYALLSMSSSRANELAAMVLVSLMILHL